jgi:hypothetical protein
MWCPGSGRTSNLCRRFDTVASFPPEPHTSYLDAFFQTLVEWLEKKPDAFASIDCTPDSFHTGFFLDP